MTSLVYTFSNNLITDVGADADGDDPMIRFIRDIQARAGRLSDDALAELIASHEPSMESTRRWHQFSQGNYARNLVYRDDRFEILCLCWGPGQETIMHGHGESVGAIRVVLGAAFELCQEDGIEEPRRYTHATGVVGRVGRGLVHKVGNAHPTENLITLHVYSPPLQGVVGMAQSEVIKADAKASGQRDGERAADDALDVRKGP